MRSGIIDKIPHDQEVIDISHLLDNGKLIIKLRQQLVMAVRITLDQSLMTQFVQIRPGIIPVRHCKVRQLRHAEFNLHMTPVCNLLGILDCLRGIGKKCAHLLLGFDIILSALIAHPVLIGQLFPCLQAQQDIMCLPVLRIGIVHVVGGDKFNTQFLAKPHQTGIHCLLIRNSVILQFQEIIALTEACLIALRRLLRLIIKTSDKITLHLTCQTGTQRNQPLMILF